MEHVTSRKCKNLLQYMINLTLSSKKQVLSLPILDELGTSL